MKLDPYLNVDPGTMSQQDLTSTAKSLSPKMGQRPTWTWATMSALWTST